MAWALTTQPSLRMVTAPLIDTAKPNRAWDFVVATRSSELLDAGKARVLEVTSDGCSESASLVRDLKLEDQEARGERGPLPREILRGLRVFVLVGRAQGEATADKFCSER